MCQNFNDSDIVIKPSSQCLKITEKVSFSSASEASYIYTLSVSRQKLVENAKIEKSQNVTKGEKIRESLFTF